MNVFGKIENKSIIPGLSIIEFYSFKTSNTFKKSYTKEELTKLLCSIKELNSFTSLSVNKYKLAILYNILNNDQKKVFININKKLSIKKTIFTLDAKPGTGKTFLIATLGALLKELVLYIVYTNNLENALSNINNLHSMTCCKFIMLSMQVNFMKSLYIWYEKEKSFMEMVLYILDLAKQYKLEYEKPIQLLVLDEYTTVSPWFIVYLYFVSILFNLPLLFTGDKFQQDSISKTKYHPKNNFAITSIISDNVYTLKTNVRQKNDKVYLEKLKSICDFIWNENENLKLTFHFKYLIFTLFFDHFFVKPNYNALFMSQYHCVIKKRLLNMIKYLEESNKYYIKCYFSKKKNNKFVRCKELLGDTSNSKFLPYLILVKNSYYIYVDERNTRNIVKLKDVINDSLVVETLSGAILNIKRQVISTDFVNSEQIFELKKFGTLYQFPIRQFTSTFHAAQGITFDVCSLDIDLDAYTVNSIYVALTRICSENQLNKISTQDLVDLLLTSYFNDDYYYKAAINNREKYFNLLFLNCNGLFKFKKKLNINTLQFKEEYDIHRFLKLKCLNIKIKKTTFSNIEKTQTNTLLETFLLYVKNNLKNSTNLFDCIKNYFK